MKSASIAVFDSGLGGLTVLNELRRHLPHENFIYLGDTARLPYGSKSMATIRTYAEKNIRYLQRLNIKAVVVACNSASAALLETPRLELDVPWFEVITPGAKAALRATQNQRIAVLGTYATIKGQAYEHTLKARNPNLKIFSQACPLLVPLVEEGWLNDPLTNLIIHRYTAELTAQNPDTYILGCTHYPALSSAFRKVLGAGVQLVNSAEQIAQDLAAEFASGRIEAATSTGLGSLAIFTTDKTARFDELSSLLLGEKSIKSEVISID